MAAVTVDSTLLSKLGSEFQSRYTIHERLGKGHFGVVHRCVRISDGKVFAVKVVDIRPLRLKENFSRERLLREVSIQQQLRHPHIVALEEHMWNHPQGDHLLLVLEYAPGRELFDLIIENGKYSEERAKPVVAQLLSALSYMHGKEIVHRDIKPENVLVLDVQHSEEQYAAAPIVKLLDFGLSRSVGSQGATTFVGTPEYYAPEVDTKMRQGGSFGTYGVQADCWSLGAVIFVMLSGVFPEFTGVGNSRLISFARASHWGSVSDGAKDLISKLMHPDPAQRIAASAAVHHPWVQGALVLSRTSSATTEMIGQKIQDLSICPSTTVQSRKRTRTEETAVPDLSKVQLQGEQDTFMLQTNRLFMLQRQVVVLLEQAYALYQNNRDCQSAKTIRSHIIQMRQQFEQSAGLMHKLGGTARNVLEVIPDIRLGVEENMPQAADQFFATIQSWISELKSESQGIMQGNSGVIQALNSSMEAAKQGVLSLLDETPARRSSSSMYPPPEIVQLDSVLEKASNDQPLSPEDILDLACPRVSHKLPAGNLVSQPSDITMEDVQEIGTQHGVKLDVDTPLVVTPPRSPTAARLVQLSDRQRDHIMHLREAMKNLMQVDQILSRFALFWNHMEAAVSLLLQKNEHVESLLKFSHNDRMKSRFLLRLSGYQDMWTAIEAASKQYAASVRIDPRDPLMMNTSPPRSCALLMDGHCETKQMESANTFEWNDSLAT